MAVKTGRNDPCWCGSGRKFKKCHLGRDSQARVPFRAIQSAARKVWDQKQCLHPQAAPGVCDKVISAHTVQRSRVLQRLVDETNHVETFHRTASASGPVTEPRRVGWQVASTFTGFCSAHDASTFAPLETERFKGTPEQCFLIGYRALCYEVYQKRGLLRSVPAVRHLVDRGFPAMAQRQIQHAEDLVEAGARKGLEAMVSLKSAMDAQLLSKEFSGWSRLLVQFRGELSVAATGGVAPNRDFDGQVLQELHDADPAKQQTLLCGVTALEEGGAVVLTWPTTQEAPRRFVQSLLARGRLRVPHLLVQFLFVHLENTYFSANWWKSLGEQERRHLATLAAIVNPYYDAFSYTDATLVPWEVLEITLQDAA